MILGKKKINSNQLKAFNFKKDCVNIEYPNNLIKKFFYRDIYLKEKIRIDGSIYSDYYLLKPIRFHSKFKRGQLLSYDIDHTIIQTLDNKWRAYKKLNSIINIKNLFYKDLLKIMQLLKYLSLIVIIFFSIFIIILTLINFSYALYGILIFLIIKLIFELNKKYYLGKIPRNMHIINSRYLIINCRWEKYKNTI
jgi:hypothetical protein